MAPVDTSAFVVVCVFTTVGRTVEIPMKGDDDEETLKCAISFDQRNIVKIYIIRSK